MLGFQSYNEHVVWRNEKLDWVVHSAASISRDRGSKRRHAGKDGRPGPDVPQPQCRVQEQDHLGGRQGLSRVPALLHQAPSGQQWKGKSSSYFSIESSC